MSKKKKIINIKVDGCIAISPEEKIVCDNKHYRIKFHLSDEWMDEYAKTARFIYKENIIDEPFEGDEVDVPPVIDASILLVGIYAGDLHTTTSAVVECLPSVRGKKGAPADPPTSLYDKLIELINNLKVEKGHPSDRIPLVDGVASPGESAEFSRGDHIHPTDTSRASAQEVKALREAITHVNVSLIDGMSGLSQSIVKEKNRAEGAESEISQKLSTVESIAKGANQAISYPTYKDMLLGNDEREGLLALDSKVLNIGQSILIGTKDVPDVWVYKYIEPFANYEYKSEEEFANRLKTETHIQVGFYELYALETQKVDLVDYAKKETVEAVKDTIDLAVDIARNAEKTAVEMKDEVTESITPELEKLDESKQDKLSFEDEYNANTNKAATVATVTRKIAEIIANAPEDFDTLKELADWLDSHGKEAAEMNSAIKSNTEAIEELEKSKFSGSYNDLTDQPTIPTVPENVSAFTNDAGYVKNTDYAVEDGVSGIVKIGGRNQCGLMIDSQGRLIISGATPSLIKNPLIYHVALTSDNLYLWIKQGIVGNPSEDWSDDDKSKARSLIGAASDEKLTEVEGIAKGANQSLVYDNYQSLITDALQWAVGEYREGQNIYIKDVNVPDLWISFATTDEMMESGDAEFIGYDFDSDEAIVEHLKEYDFLDVGYYQFAPLETQKVDLSNVPTNDDLANYVKNTDYATGSKGGVVKASAGDTGQGIYVDNSGRIQLGNMESYIKDRIAGRAIRNQDLDYAIKVGLTTNTETLTDEEKAKAQVWLGVADSDEVLDFFGTDGTTGLKYDISDTEASCLGVDEVTETDVEIASKVRGKLVTSTAENAFENCESVSSITISNSVKKINRRFCYNALGVTRVFIPSSVIEFGTETSLGIFTADSSFFNCNALTIYCEAEALPSGWDPEWNYLNHPVVWDCNNNDVADDGYMYKAIDGVSYGIKDNVATLKRVSLNVTTVNVPSTLIHKDVKYSITSVADSAFRGCTSLTDVIIHNGVVTIGGNAFYGCTSLKTLTIPKSVTSIVTPAFYDCSSLTDIYYEGTESEFREIDGYSILNSKTIHYNCEV